MADSLTLASIETTCRQRFEFPDTTRITSDEMQGYILTSIKHFHDLVIESNEEAVLGSSQITIYSASGEYVLPDHFYKVRAIDIEEAGQKYDMERFQWNERNNFQTTASSPLNTRYSITNNVLYLRPIPAYTGTITVWYIPTAEYYFANGKNSYNFINGWEEWVLLDVGIKCYLKEDFDIQALLTLREMQEKRLASSSNRDRNIPKQMIDVSGRRGLPQNNLYPYGFRYRR